jgi:hypothetical protein
MLRWYVKAWILTSCAVAGSLIVAGCGGESSRIPERSLSCIIPVGSNDKFAKSVVSYAAMREYDLIQGKPRENHQVYRLIGKYSELFVSNAFKEDEFRVYFYRKGNSNPNVISDELERFTIYFHHAVPGLDCKDFVDQKYP